MSLSVKNVRGNSKYAILVIVVIITMISSLIIVYNSYRESEIVKKRDSLPAPKYNITYDEYANTDQVWFGFQTNCEATIYDHILDEKEYNSGEPKKRFEDNMYSQDEKVGGAYMGEGRSGSYKIDYAKDRKNEYMYCGYFPEFSRFVIGNKYTVIDYEKIVSGYEKFKNGEIVNPLPPLKD
jgi:hypothetical protein